MQNAALSHQCWPLPYCFTRLLVSIRTLHVKIMQYAWVLRENSYRQFIKCFYLLNRADNFKVAVIYQTGMRKELPSISTHIWARFTTFDAYKLTIICIWNSSEGSVGLFGKIWNDYNQKFICMDHSALHVWLRSSAGTLSTEHWMNGIHSREEKMVQQRRNWY